MAYLILSCLGGASAQPFETMILDLRARGWTQALGAHGLAVMVQGQANTPVRALGDWRGIVGAVVGEVFDRAALDEDGAALFDLEPLGQSAREDPPQVARALAREAFGDYVGLIRRFHGGAPVVFTDPLGGRPAFAWGGDGVTVVGDAPPEGLAGPRDVAIDWEGVRDLMADRRRMGGAPPLKGVTWIEPGVCRQGPELSLRETLWTPARAARPGWRAGYPEHLRRAVDGAVRAFLLGRQRVLCEISGGLDSAIVATSLKAVGRPADQALNFYRAQVEADERVYAEAAAERASTPLRCVERPLLALTEAGLMRGAGAFRPNFEILDTDYDDFTLAAIADTEADIVFTGHGGDVVFYQLQAAALAGDLLRGVPCEGSRLARLTEVSLRTRRSIWSLAAQAVRGRPNASVVAATTAPRMIAPPIRPGLWHPWMAGLGAMPPAKRAQISGLALTQGVFADTRRGAAARQCHPLLSQPVVEACLAIPAPILSQGEGERSFARATFADRLPDSIVRRRSKGDISVFLGRTLALNVDLLRAFLLDGRLAAERVVDRAALEAVLHPEALIFQNAYGELLAAVVLEAYVRYWETRPPLAALVPGSSAVADAPVDSVS